MTRRALITAAVATLAFAALSAALAGAAKKPKNGGFEKGNLSGWQVLDVSDNETDTWYVYSGTTLPDPFEPLRPLERGIPTAFTAPPQGNFAAVTVQGSEGTHILHRTLKLKKGKSHKLKLRVYYRNDGADFFSPNSLDAQGGFDNQQYRIDLLKRNAPLDSVDGDDILKRIFGTEPGDPSEIQPKKLQVNLTKFAGKTVRLRFAEADNQNPFNAAVDAVKLKSKPEN